MKIIKPGFEFITPIDGSVILKVARIKTGVKGDSFVDLAGYAACAGEIATEAPKAPPVNTCISCGAEIPEGRQVCPNCLGGDPHGER